MRRSSRGSNRSRRRGRCVETAVFFRRMNPSEANVPVQARTGSFMETLSLSNYDPCQKSAALNRLQTIDTTYAVSKRRMRKDTQIGVETKPCQAVQQSRSMTITKVSVREPF